MDVIIIYMSVVKLTYVDKRGHRNNPTGQYLSSFISGDILIGDDHHSMEM